MAERIRPAILLLCVLSDATVGEAARQPAFGVATTVRNSSMLPATQ
jgi:hypothetical protein